MWINEVNKPKVEAVIKVKPVEKGLIIEALAYSCFYWKNTRESRELIMVLSQFVANPNDSYQLLITPDKKHKRGFTLEIGTKQAWNYDGECWLTTDEDCETYISLSEKLALHRTTLTLSSGEPENEPENLPEEPSKKKKP